MSVSVIKVKIMENRAYYAKLLQDILENGSSLALLKDEIDNPNKGFFNMLFMTTFRQLTFIKDEILPQFVKKKIPQKQIILQYLLYLGAAELLFMNTPDYAVLNSYVDAAKEKTDKFGANFINAVLRNILRHKDKLLENRKSRYFGSEFLKILKQDYTAEEISGMEKFAAIEPPLDLTFKTDVLPDIESSVILPTGSIRMPANTKATQIPGFSDGLFWVQDAASALPVKCLPSLKGKKVLDLCAAPGGKTAQLLAAGAKVTAVDVSEKRLERLKENLDRLKFSDNLTVFCSDARTFDCGEKYDVILVDAPCSATGTFRRHPEIMHTKTLKDVRKQAGLQEEILEHSATLLAANGLLLYATCSLSKIEGELMIKKFLKRHTDFSILSIKVAGAENMMTKEGFIRILPQYFNDFLGIDGFFIALLQRKI